ncbi:LysR family transcriptional regulator [Zwartia sp.]|uniref:LysR family transcriptional regulator n=1 Tax=Zwartia sp. TaxID=2978004 RepID=UPI003BAF25F2
MKIESKQMAREALTPEALEMLLRIAETGSFASAAREVGMVPSALTYRVRQIEEALDVLLFDRSSRQARLTEAGLELVREGRRMLNELDAIANRVKRVATGWEPQFTIAIDSIINHATVMDLCTSFLALNPPTRLRIRTETLSGTLEALTSGLADLSLGVVAEAGATTGLQIKPLGVQRFIFAVAPHHPLAGLDQPLSDETIGQYRAVAAADSVQRGGGVSVGLISGQDVFTVSTMQSKLDAQLRGLGCGFLPEGLARPYIETGRLIAKRVERVERQIQASYAWLKTPIASRGRALQWWLEQLEHAHTRQALMLMT